MRDRTFVTFNVLGGLVWAVGVTTLGYVLGESISDIDRYLYPIIGLIILLSLLPVALEVLRARRARSRQD
jgi:membrane-associated protein